MRTALFAPACPICRADGSRELYWPSLVLDCQCGSCGYFYTSELRRAVLRALTNRRVSP